MSIATEIQRIQNAKTDIKTFLEENGLDVGDATIDQYAELMKDLSIGGGSDLSALANSITFKNLNVFGTKDVEVYLPNVTDLSSFCLIEKDYEENKNTTVENLTVTCDKPVIKANRFCRVGNMTYPDTKLKKVTLNVDFSQCTDFGYMFCFIQGLEVIDGTPINMSSIAVNTNPFHYATSLKEIRFAPNSINKSLYLSQSSLLSDETIESIIEGLGDMNGEIKYYEVGQQVGPSDFEYPEVEVELKDIKDVYDAWMFMTDGATVYSVTYGSSYIQTYAYAKGGITQTLMLHPDVKNRLTSSQRARITAKNWNIS